MFIDGHASIGGESYAWEIIRLARRGRSTFLRTTYALALAAGLCIVYASHFTGGDVLALLDDAGQTMSLNDLATYSRNFVASTLLLQGFAVLILTPPYIAGAISEEKERGSLELLFTTHLHDHEIVLGKLLARVTHLAGILLAGLPILSLAQLWGGVDILVVVAMTIVTLMTLVSYGSICILVSVQSKQTWAAMVTSYMLLGGIATCCGCVPIIYLASPMGFLYQLDAEFAGRSGFVAIWGGSGVQPDQLAVMLSLVGQYVLVHGIIALICLTWAARELRSTTRSAPPRPLPRPVKLSEWGPEAPQPALARIHKPILFPADHGYPMGDRPLLWREAYQGGSPTNTGFLIDMLTMLFCVFLIVQIVLLLSVLSNAGSEFYLFVQEYINPCIKVGTIILGLLLCVSVAFRAAGTFSRERDQKTLDSLLLLPIPRRSILVAKWLGSILRFRRLIWLLLALWAFGVVITALHPLAAVALAVALALHVALLATIGVWLSLACRNTVSAYFATALLLMLLFLGSWLVLLNTAIAGPTASFYGIWLERFLEIGLNPIVCWWHLAANWRTTTGLLADLGVLRWFDTAALSAGLLVFALLGLLVWHAAEERLGGEPRMLNPGGATPHPQSSKTRPGA